MKYIQAPNPWLIYRSVILQYSRVIEYLHRSRPPTTLNWMSESLKWVITLTDAGFTGDKPPTLPLLETCSIFVSKM